MRVAFVNGSISGGGAERVTANLCNALAAEGVEIHLLTESAKEGEYPLDPGIHRAELLTMHLLSDVWRVRSYLQQQAIDVVVGMGIYMNLVLCLANVCLRTRVIISERNDPRHDALSWKTRLLRTLVYGRADGYVFQTAEERDYYGASIRQRSTIIGNLLRDGLPWRAEEHALALVAAGRLMPQKNYPLMLRAFQLVHARHPEYVLRIYGQGIEEPHLRALTEELGIAGQVIFEGFQLDVHRAMRDGDIFVMTSDFEGMPNALMEAMAMGFPVVSTDCYGGGPRALTQNGQCGLLAQMGDAQDIADKICWLIEHPEEKEQMGQKAKNVRERYGLESILRAWKEFLHI